MNPRSSRSVLPNFALLLASLLAAHQAPAQGALLPGATPVPTMRTLAQIEPRTPIESLAADATATYVISTPGAYYLSAGNVTAASGRAAIAIASNDVTVDLNGFAVVGAAGATRGIELRGNIVNVSVRNGSIRNWIGSGVGAASGSPASVTLDDLRISGIAGPAIDLQAASAVTVTRCAISGSRSGIQLGTASTVMHCSVWNLASSGGTAYGILASTVAQSSVDTVTAAAGGFDAVGINASAVTGCTVMNVSGTGNGSTTGIQGGSVADCKVGSIGTANTGPNLGISSDSVTNCSVDTVGNSGSLSIQYGIVASGPVRGCRVITIGALGGTAYVEGIDAEIVTDCKVSSVFTTGPMFGINAKIVSGCSVNFCTQNGSSTAGVTGIAAERISECRVDTITGSTSATVVALAPRRSISGSTVNNVSNSGAGGAFGLDLGSGATADGCHVALSNGVGIRATAAARILNCEVAGSSTVIGIDAQAGSTTLDGNNVSGCATGIKASGSTLVIRNHVTTSTAKFTVTAACQVGQIVSATGGIASTSPWANFTD